MDRIIITAVLFLNLLKILFYFFFYLKIKKRNNDNIAIKVILYFLFISAMVNGIIVNFFRLISNSEIIHRYNVTSFDILKVEFFELISSSIFLFILYLTYKSSKKRTDSTEKTNRTNFILSFICILCISNFFIPNGSNIFLFGESLDYLSGPISIILIYISIINKKYNYLLISIPLLILVIFKIFSSGVRGPIVGLFFIILFLFIISLSTKQILKKIPIFLIPILLILTFNNQYSKIKFAFASAYTLNPKDYQTVGDLFYFIVNFYKDGTNLTVEGSDSSIFEEIEFRLGAKSMYSVGFIRFVERSGFVYLNPIINTFYIFIPRYYFNENKPYPDSYDGQISGMGMYVCANEIDNGVNMTEFYASTHYYWQFGILGILFLPIISALYIIFIFFLSKKMSLYLKLLFLFFSLKPYYFFPQFTISDIIVMLVSKIFPFIILIYILNFIYSFKNILSTKSIKSLNKTI